MSSRAPLPTLTPARLQVIEVTTSKTGKHGHAKCHFTATDIFTGKKMEELVPSSHNLEVRCEQTLPQPPNVSSFLACPPPLLVIMIS